VFSLDADSSSKSVAGTFVSSFDSVVGDATKSCANGGEFDETRPPIALTIPSMKSANAPSGIHRGVTGCVGMANSKQKRLALDFANFTINKENSELWAQTVGELPANQKAKVPDAVASLQFTPQQLEKYAYTPNWRYMATQLDTWAKRFEKDITPKL
jgi:ABC-type glycerol-3-phosphate transport system substrate-binding protein